MNSPKMIPSGSQTVGPYFHIGLDHMPCQGLKNELAFNEIRIRGKVLDRDGAPVSDAMLEFWSPDKSGTQSGTLSDSTGNPVGFHRVSTDLDGNFLLTLDKPGPTLLRDGLFQAPHLVVLVFARGLLRHLITRVYFEQEAANAVDPLLLTIPEERRHTLIAGSDEGSRQVFQWNVILQGNNETVFFAW
jgi:protocatechuate 3,4-dioxygenase alpha subunit